MYLEFTVAANADDDTYVTANYGHAAIDNIELEIGGQSIDRQHGHWMEAWAELTEPNDAGHSSADTTQGDEFGKRFLIK